jgi:hypothetical protein
MVLTEVSLTLGVTATKTAEGGVDLKVLQVKGGASHADERTITVKFEVLKDRVITTARSNTDVLDAIRLSDHAESHVRRARRAPAKKATKKRSPAKRRAPAKKAARRR